MENKILKIHPEDNVIVALQDLKQGEVITLDNENYTLLDPVKAMHKFIAEDVAIGGGIKMYGVFVGVAKEYLPKGRQLNTSNIQYPANDYTIGKGKTDWQRPNVENWQAASFWGYHRNDGTVGVANYWLVIPMVFCENRNVDLMKEALLENLGYRTQKKYNQFTKNLVDLYSTGKDLVDIVNADFEDASLHAKDRIFPNIDGVKFLTHQGGCGGIRQDSEALCGLLAGYITHPNVAGVTVLSLGCQNAQVSILEKEIHKRSPAFDKPMFILEQQKIGKESDLLTEAIKQTFAGLAEVNKQQRKEASIKELCVGLASGGSDGFSGISANPAIGYTADLLVALGGKVILSEFPELCGVERGLSDRCLREENAARFTELMKKYSASAVNAGSTFDMNPSQDKIKDGLISDVITSAGAAQKGGTSPIVDVLDYPEKVTRPGLNLLCTPGNDVESTTAEVGSGATMVLFTTGLGRSTGNPIAPVIKLSTNTALFNKMNEIIDIDTGTIINGEETIEEAGSRILNFILEVASGRQPVKAVVNGQDDFIPWKRGISL